MANNALGLAKSYGSSTLILAFVQGTKLSVYCIGDSKLMVFRKN